MIFTHADDYADDEGARLSCRCVGAAGRCAQLQEPRSLYIFLRCGCRWREASRGEARNAQPAMSVSFSGEVRREASSHSLSFRTRNSRATSHTDAFLFDYDGR